MPPTLPPWCGDGDEQLLDVKMGLCYDAGSERCPLNNRSFLMSNPEISPAKKQLARDLKIIVLVQVIHGLSHAA